MVCGQFVADLAKRFVKDAGNWGCSLDNVGELVTIFQYSQSAFEAGPGQG